MSKLFHLNTVTEAMKALSHDKPKHPLIEVFSHPRGTIEDYGDHRFTGELYTITLKDGIEGEFGYGRNSYDFHEGTMTFMAPGQVITPGKVKIDEDSQNWSIMFHPDLIHGTSLGNTIDAYSFFDYDSAEALHLSDEEKDTLTQLAEKIKKEINNTMDMHSQKLIISNLELILDYCYRYYDRQFYTRTHVNKDIVTRFESLLKDYFNKDLQLEHGIPTVKYCGEALNISPNYLSDLLKKETERNATDHIQSYVIKRAKNLLLSSEESISQVAYSLGFEYSQHFSKIFKQKTGLSPLNSGV